MLNPAALSRHSPYKLCESVPLVALVGTELATCFLIGEKRAPEELTVISCRWDGKKLEAESSCLFGETHLGSPLCLFIQRLKTVSV